MLISLNRSLPVHLTSVAPAMSYWCLCYSAQTFYMPTKFQLSGYYSPDIFLFQSKAVPSSAYFTPADADLLIRTLDWRVMIRDVSQSWSGPSQETLNRCCPVQSFSFSTSGMGYFMQLATAVLLSYPPLSYSFFWTWKWHPFITCRIGSLSYYQIDLTLLIRRLIFSCFRLCQPWTILVGFFRAEYLHQAAYFGKYFSQRCTAICFQEKH